MSGRGGIYKGPYSEALYGDGREVKPMTEKPTQAPAVPAWWKGYCSPELKDKKIAELEAEIASLQAKLAEAERKGWNEAIEAAYDKADFGMIAPEDVRALAKESK